VAHDAGPITLSFHTVRLQHAVPFRTSHASVRDFEVLEVTVKWGEHIGHGEAAPYDRYGETIESASAFLADAATLLGEDPFAFDEINARLKDLDGQMAARSAVSAALHDLCGASTGLPVWRLLGVRRRSPPTSITIGIENPDEMARQAQHWSDGRFRRLKLKLGGADRLDVERVRAVRAATSLPLQVDVNERWSFDEARDTIPQLANLHVEYVEQPLVAGDPDGGELKRESPLPIFVDEDCHTLEDLAGCAQCAHGVNIKLAKTGGLREAIRLIHSARAMGLAVMIGCMSESSLGIAAACPIASLSDYVDLDMNLLLELDPWIGLELVDGAQLPSTRSGLGLVRRPAPALYTPTGAAEALPQPGRHTALSSTTSISCAGEPAPPARDR
jgi:L-alanine-DL-glutamate epimerase-like enolase superfamily enzyme